MELNIIAGTPAGLSRLPTIRETTSVTSFSPAAARLANCASGILPSSKIQDRSDRPLVCRGSESTGPSPHKGSDVSFPVRLSDDLAFVISLMASVAGSMASGRLCVTLDRSKDERRTIRFLFPICCHQARAHPPLQNTRETPITRNPAGRAPHCLLSVTTAARAGKRRAGRHRSRPARSPTAAGDRQAAMAATILADSEKARDRLGPGLEGT